MSFLPLQIWDFHQHNISETIEVWGIGILNEFFVCFWLYLKELLFRIISFFQLTQPPFNIFARSNLLFFFVGTHSMELCIIYCWSLRNYVYEEHVEGTLWNKEHAEKGACLLHFTNIPRLNNLYLHNLSTRHMITMLKSSMKTMKKVQMVCYISVPLNENFLVFV